MRALRLAMWVMVCVSPAYADVFSMFGTSARSQGMAGSVGASSEGHGSVYDNPAGLVHGPPRLTLGMYGNYNRTSIRLMERPTGYTPPGYDRRVNERQDTDEFGSSGGFTLGATLQPWKGRLSLGLSLAMPFAGVANLDTGFTDEREQYFSNQLSFVRAGDSSRRESMSLGLGFRFNPWLSMGVGFMLQPRVETINRVYTPNAAEPDNVYINVETKSGLSEALVVGLLFEPYDFLSVGLTVQDELGLELTGRNEVQVRATNNEDVFTQPLEIVQGYHPPRAAASLALRHPVLGLVDLGVNWMGWARFKDGYGYSDQFKDVFEYRLGVELPFGGDSFFRFGSAWKPTPVVAQTGRTNYVDNDIVVFAAGGGRRFELWGASFQVDVSAQIQGLLANEVHKRADSDLAACSSQTNALCDEFPDPGEGVLAETRARSVGLQTGNPGFPGFNHGGYIVHAGLELQWLY